MRMLQLCLFYVVPSLFATSALAATTICKVESQESWISALSWDTDSKKAKLQMRFLEPDEGRVVMSREHDGGLKTNLRFHLTDDPSAELELMVFPVSKTMHRVVGVRHRVVSGTKVLDLTLGNYEALCSTL